MDAYQFMNECSKHGYYFRSPSSITDAKVHSWIMDMQLLIDILRTKSTKVDPHIQNHLNEIRDICVIRGISRATLVEDLSSRSIIEILIVDSEYARHGVNGHNTGGLARACRTVKKWIENNY